MAASGNGTKELGEARSGYKYSEQEEEEEYYYP